MRGKELLDKMEFVDPAYIEDADFASPKSKIPWSKCCAAAACIAALVTLSLTCYAAYQKWILPKPESYTLDPKRGVYVEHDSETYTELPSSVPENDVFTDEYFLARSAEIISQIGLNDIETSTMTVVRQENQFWAREEVEVYFDQDKNNTSIKFDAKSGYMLSLSGIDWIETPEGAACASEEEALALASDYYANIPVPQGYEYTGCTEYDEQYWSFEFCKKVGEDLYNYYEMVRIGINPVSGRLTGVNVFYVPLLDDHGPDDKPLTQEQAEKIAAACPYLNLDNYQLESAKIAVVLPNWWYTEYMTGAGTLKASDVTRLGWSLIYNNPNSEFADKICIDIDLYTGDILGGGMT